MNADGRTPKGDDLEELIALYAVGALAPAESHALEARLAAAGPEAAALLRTLTDVAAALAQARAVAPPPRVREELLRRLDDEPAGAPTALHIARASEAVWEALPYPGLHKRLLHLDCASGRYTALVRMAPGASYPAHDHAGVEECLVLEGDLHVGGEVLRAGDYQRALAGSHHVEQTTEGGCLVLLVGPLPV